MDAASTTRHVMVRCPFCAKLNRVDASRAKDRPKCGECSRPILLDRPVIVTDQDLDRVIAESDIPVVVDFYADWCGPCKVMAPVFDEVARDRMGSILFTKLDTDRNQQMAVKYGIRGIPTLAVFKGGREIERQVGAVPRAELNLILDRATSPAA
jgi:thioredoxin 2